MQTERPLTPKERYDLEIKSINRSNAEVNGLDPDIEEQVDEIMEQTEGERVLVPNESETQKTLDKSMGDVKVNNVPSDSQKQDQITAQKCMAAYAQLQNSKKSQLSKEERVLLTNLMGKFKKKEVANPILVHLLQQKNEQTEALNFKQNQVRETNRKILESMTEMANMVVQVNTKLDFLDSQILDLVRQEKP